MKMTPKIFADFGILIVVILLGIGILYELHIIAELLKKLVK